MPFEEKRIFVREKDVICIKKKKNLFVIIIIIIFFFFFTKKTLFVPEKDVTIFGNDVTITL